MNTLEILRTLAGIGADEIRAALEDDSPIAAQYREDHGLHVWPIGDGWIRTGGRTFFRDDVAQHHAMVDGVELTSVISVEGADPPVSVWLAFQLDRQNKMPSRDDY